MNVGPYVPLPRRAAERRCYLKYRAVDEAPGFLGIPKPWSPGGRPESGGGSDRRCLGLAGMPPESEVVPARSLASSASLLQWQLSQSLVIAPGCYLVPKLLCLGSCCNEVKEQGLTGVNSGACEPRDRGPGAELPKGGAGCCSNVFETHGERKKASLHQPGAHALFC